MRKRASLLLATTLLVGLVVAGHTLPATGQGGPKILKFDRMIGVPDPYTVAANAIRGVPGGGLPWVVEEAHGDLRVSGRIVVEVEGLVLDPDDPDVPPAVAGTNPVASFKAIVSCQTVTAGAATIANVETGPFPATTTGDAEIKDTVDLPEPCIAPIVFVTSPTGAWFAATGFSNAAASDPAG
jgi:hypothetical protein